MKQTKTKNKLPLSLKIASYLMSILSLLSGALVLIASKYIDTTLTNDFYFMLLIASITILIVVGVPGLLFTLLYNQFEKIKEKNIWMMLGTSLIFFLNGMIATFFIIWNIEHNYEIGWYVLVALVILFKLTYLPYILIKYTEEVINDGSI